MDQLTRKCSSLNARQKIIVLLLIIRLARCGAWVRVCYNNVTPSGLGWSFEKGDRKTELYELRSAHPNLNVAECAPEEYCIANNDSSGADGCRARVCYNNVTPSGLGWSFEKGDRKTELYELRSAHAKWSAAECAPIDYCIANND